MKILILTRYGSLGASSRLRSYQFIPELKKHGIKCSSSHFVSDVQLTQLYRKHHYSLTGLFFSYFKRVFVMITAWHYDLIWIEKEALPWLPAWLEKILLFGRKYLFDYDDAIFHNYDLHQNTCIRRLLGKKIDHLMKTSTGVFAGNDYLAERARKARACKVFYVPTVVDTFRYRQKICANAVPIIVWIGSPSTVKYLDVISPALRNVAKSHSFTLRVIGAQWQCSGIKVECLPWSEDTEVKYISESDIGIMPLFDSPWERGKCAYKLIQYMACGLPTVCSPVGANNVVVTEHTGRFARNEREWGENLSELLSDISLRERLGLAGIKHIRSEYSLNVVGPMIARHLHQLVGNA